MTKKKKLVDRARELSLIRSEEALSDDKVIGLIKRRPGTTRELAGTLGVPVRLLSAYLAGMQDRGVLVRKYGTAWQVDKEPYPEDHGLKYTYHSRPDHTFLFGVVSDTHLGSKYERLDVLNDLYNRFEAVGVDRVFHAGNWIDGECRLNRHELHTHGLDGQCSYMAAEYPKKPGLMTYGITADCHEGWFAKQTQTDVGRHLERVFEEHGRDDWRNLGYLESMVPLRNSSSGRESFLCVKQRGGGTAYAISYKPQKIVEAIQGGEKPAILLIGHFHKAELLPIRNVWCIQAGSVQDQSSWTRKNAIEPHVGGWVVRARQDPRTGAIYALAGEFFMYYNKGYCNEKWNPYGPVKKSKRTLGGL